MAAGPNSLRALIAEIRTSSSSRAEAWPKPGPQQWPGHLPRAFQFAAAAPSASAAACAHHFRGLREPEARDGRLGGFADLRQSHARRTPHLFVLVSERGGERLDRAGGVRSNWLAALPRLNGYSRRIGQQFGQDWDRLLRLTPTRQVRRWMRGESRHPYRARRRAARDGFPCHGADRSARRRSPAWPGRVPSRESDHQLRHRSVARPRLPAPPRRLVAPSSRDLSGRDRRNTNARRRTDRTESQRPPRARRALWSQAPRVARHCRAARGRGAQRHRCPRRFVASSAFRSLTNPQQAGSSHRRHPCESTDPALAARTTIAPTVMNVRISLFPLAMRRRAIFNMQALEPDFGSTRPHLVSQAFSRRG